MIWAFDLDGTLADTRNAVKEAYHRAGVVVPSDACGKPASSWLCPPHYTEEEATRIHAAKCRHYIDCMEIVVPLPALELFKKADARDNVTAVLTGASKDSATLVLWHLGVWPQFLICSMTLDDKIRWLNRAPEPGVWVDDDVQAVGRVMRETKWRVIDARTLGRECSVAS